MTDVQDIHTDNEELLRLNPELAGSLGPRPKKSKYLNVRNTDPDGETYDSGIEADHARKFSLAVHAGEYLFYMHHVVFPLPGGIKIEIDHFLGKIDKVNYKIVHECYDSKALDKQTGRHRFTPEWRNKQKLFEETYHIPIGTI
jgi:hypothetical protein